MRSPFFMPLFSLQTKQSNCNGLQHILSIFFEALSKQQDSVLYCFHKQETAHLNASGLTDLSQSACVILYRICFPNQCFYFYFFLLKWFSLSFHTYTPNTLLPWKLRHELSNFITEHADATPDTILRVFPEWGMTNSCGYSQSLKAL